MQNKLTSACYTQANELNKLTNHNVGFCEAMLRANQYRAGTVFPFKIGKKLGTYKRVSNFFKLGVIPILSLLIFYLNKQTKV